VVYKLIGCDNENYILTLQQEKKPKERVFFIRNPPPKFKGSTFENQKISDINTEFKMSPLDGFF